MLCLLRKALKVLCNNNVNQLKLSTRDSWYWVKWSMIHDTEWNDSLVVVVNEYGTNQASLRRNRSTLVLAVQKGATLLVFAQCASLLKSYCRVLSPVECEPAENKSYRRIELICLLMKALLLSTLDWWMSQYLPVIQQWVESKFINRTCYNNLN